MHSVCHQLFHIPWNVSLEPEAEPEVDETPPAPPAEQQRTEQGTAMFSRLILPAPPAMFRPFMVLDEQEKIERNKQFAKSGKKAPKVSAAGTTETVI